MSVLMTEIFHGEAEYPGPSKWRRKGHRIGKCESTLPRRSVRFVTSANKLPAKYIIHAITLSSIQEQFQDTELPNGAIVRKIVQRTMQLLPLLGCHSVAFPAIGTGLAGIPLDDVAKEMAEVLVRALLDNMYQVRVELYLFDRYGHRSKEELIALFESRIRESLGLLTARKDGQDVVIAPGAGGKSEAGQPPSPEQRRREIYEMLLHLGRQRDRLESDLLAALTNTNALSTAKVSGIRVGLEEIARLREIYLRELNPDGYQKPRVQPRTGFVSSTYGDLILHRQAVMEIVRTLELHFVGMEEFTPGTPAPGEYIRQRVEESDIYLGLLGMRYGSIDANSGFSMTELEYRQAVASNKPRLMFVMDQSASITLDKLEMDAEGFAKLMVFRKHVLQDHVCGMFRGVDDLRAKVEKTLREYRSQGSS